MKSSSLFSWPARSALAVLLPLALLGTGGQAQAACSQPSSLRIQGLFEGPSFGGSRVTVLAHRGVWGRHNPNSSLIPENSIPAIRAANDFCVDGMELDVKMTKDGVPILMHDWNLGRTTTLYTKIPGAKKYSPETRTGANDLVASHTWSFIQSLFLLVPNRATFSFSSVPSVQMAIQAQREVGNYAPIIWDVKTADAARAVNAVARNFPNSQTAMAMKVNASLYRSAAAFRADVNSMRGIPVFVTNNLSQMNVAQVRDAWVGTSRVAAIEANVKNTNGFLQDELLTWAKNRNSPVGVFHALPDYPFSSNGDQFYDSDGHCCYKLSDKFFSHNGRTEQFDRRGDRSYLNTAGFTFVTTDDPIGVARYFRSVNK